MTRRQKAKAAIEHNPIYTGVAFTLALLAGVTQIEEAYELFYGFYQQFEPVIIFGGGLVVICALAVTCLRLKIHSAKDADVEQRLNGLERMMRKLCRHNGIDPDTD